MSEAHKLPDEQFIIRYWANISADRARQEARDYTDTQIQIVHERAAAALASQEKQQSIIESNRRDALIKAENATALHFNSINNLNERIRELVGSMATKAELMSAMERVHEQSEATEKALMVEVKNLQMQLDELKGTKDIFGGGMGLAKYAIGLGLTILAIVIAYLALKGSI